MHCFPVLKKKLHYLHKIIIAIDKIYFSMYTVPRNEKRGRTLQKIFQIICLRMSCFFIILIPFRILINHSVQCFTPLVCWKILLIRLMVSESAILIFAAWRGYVFLIWENLFYIISSHQVVFFDGEHQWFCRSKQTNTTCLGVAYSAIHRIKGNSWD